MHVHRLELLLNSLLEFYKDIKHTCPPSFSASLQHRPGKLATSTVAYIPPAPAITVNQATVSVDSCLLIVVRNPHNIILAFIHRVLNFLFLKDFYLFIYFLIERERGKEGEKHRCVAASCMPPTGNLASNPGVCPRLGIKRAILWLAGRLALNH